MTRLLGEMPRNDKKGEGRNGVGGEAASPMREEWEEGGLPKSRKRLNSVQL